MNRSGVLVRLIGLLAIIGIVGTYWMGLVVTPPDVFQGNLVRLVYLHPPVAWVAYLAYGVTSLASIAFLWKRTRNLKWDRLAASSAEVGVLFTGLTLVTGSIWGRPTWGVWWTWDARLTTTALLFLLYLGYLAIRRIPGDRYKVGTRSAVAGLVAFIDVPIVHQSVVWWKTLHQGATVLNPSLSPKIHGEMAWTLLLGFVSFTLLYVWFTIKRYQVASMTDELEDVEVDRMIRERLESDGGVLSGGAPRAESNFVDGGSLK
ncbi:MAG: cytochrome c biogenesis protein CcsA [Acidimicrobiaceae bacterium]|nr:cytochrome c biogenesis protein CcsA [Acidimicrobiaceae bacterium]